MCAHACCCDAFNPRSTLSYLKSRSVYGSIKVLTLCDVPCEPETKECNECCDDTELEHSILLHEEMAYGLDWPLWDWEEQFVD
jgi:hypothetical protein